MLELKKRDAHTESFESFSDLMTLLTIALIVVSVFMGLEYLSAESSPDVIKPLLKEAEKGSAAEVVLEEDTIVFLFSVDSYDVVYDVIMVQGGQRRRTFHGSLSELHSFLDKHFNAIKHATHTYLVSDKNPASKRNDFVFSTLMWFANRQLHTPILILWNY